MATQGGPTPAPAATAGRGVKDRSGGLVSGAPPEPVGLTTLDDLAARLTDLREWAGNPSYTQIARRVADARIRARPAQRRHPAGSPLDCFRAVARASTPSCPPTSAALAPIGSSPGAWFTPARTLRDLRRGPRGVAA